MVWKVETGQFWESSGNSTRKFQEDLTDAITDFACNIWQTYPRYITNNNSPGTSFARGYMNAACSGGGYAPVPLDPPPFTGGQCCDKPYIVLCSYQFVQCNGNIAAQGSANPTVTGAIQGLFFQENPDFPGQYELRLVFTDCNGVSDFVSILSTTQAVQDDCTGNPGGTPTQSDWNLAQSTFQIDSITTADGSPDDCGSPPIEYPPEPPPGPGDLTENVDIPSADGVPVNVTFEWNQTNNSYNFPMTFNMNGSPVVFDFSGFTVYGDRGVESPSGNEPGNEPGSQGGRNEVGDVYVNVYPDAGYLTNPEIVTPEVTPEDVATLVCTDGVIETITEVTKLPVSQIPLATLLVGLIGEITRELCELGGETSELGFPEVYPALPGVERPVILYYYKVVTDGTKGKSTYTSTVSNPSATAIAGINTASVPSKFTGIYVASVKLADGSRIVASGADEAAAIQNHNFLLNQVESSLVPQDLSLVRVITKNQRISSLELTCVQIEFYPNGRASGVTPAVRRIIPVT